MNRKTVIIITGVFFILWSMCAWTVFSQNSRIDPAYRTAWTLRVVKVVDHIVKKGESLTKIAKKYGVSIGEILKVNKISAPEKVKEGEKIKIPLRNIKGEILI